MTEIIDLVDYDVKIAATDMPHMQKDVKENMNIREVKNIKKK